MATLRLNARSQSDDRAPRGAARYSLCYVLGGDCYYELHARMVEAQRRVLALVGAGATDFSLLRSNGVEIANHDDLIRRAQAASMDRTHS